VIPPPAVISTAVDQQGVRRAAQASGGAAELCPISPSGAAVACERLGLTGAAAGPSWRSERRWHRSRRARVLPPSRNQATTLAGRARRRPWRRRRRGACSTPVVSQRSAPPAWCWYAPEATPQRPWQRRVAVARVAPLRVLAARRRRGSTTRAQAGTGAPPAAPRPSPGEVYHRAPRRQGCPRCARRLRRALDPGSARRSRLCAGEGRSPPQGAPNRALLAAAS
jgi:hypothetical protein